ncbi:hypothetical protein NKG05_16570 [Oerskovia sp. M15]
MILNLTDDRQGMGRVIDEPWELSVLFVGFGDDERGQATVCQSSIEFGVPGQDLVAAVEEEGGGLR